VVECGGLENVSEEIGLNVFNRPRRYWSGRLGMIWARLAQNWATIWATDSGVATKTVPTIIRGEFSILSSAQSFAQR
jgi:hypothetical protein